MVVPYSNVTECVLPGAKSVSHRRCTVASPSAYVELLAWRLPLIQRQPVSPVAYPSPSSLEHWSYVPIDRSVKAVVAVPEMGPVAMTL